MDNHRMLEISRVLSQNIRNTLLMQNFSYDKLEEIRLRSNMPLIVRYDNSEVMINKCILSSDDIHETLELISNHSLYAYEDDVRQGFITIPGGHRVGLCGRVVTENGRIKTIKHISFMNIRIAHQVRGCADSIYNFIHREEKIENTLIISPPGCGKTTLLRDLIRQISNGNSYYDGQTVGVVDERSEIGACYHGRPQNDLGIRTDVLDCCPKDIGMLMLIRSMSPKVIAVDEIATMSDIEAVRYVLNCGCTIIGTAHANNLKDLSEKPFFKEMLEEKLFRRIVTLTRKDGIGKILEEVCL
ncbi:MAG: stage III sporulation protein AA [Bacteroides sp.]